MNIPANVLSRLEAAIRNADGIGNTKVKAADLRVLLLAIADELDETPPKKR
jgi:hypothetical protein